jgi:DNA polymerase-1
MRAADARLAELIASHSTTVYTLNGGEFNIGSPKQLAAALYKNGLPARFTKGGAPSTAKDALYKLAKGNPIAATVLKIRSCEKLRAYCSEFEEYRRGDLLSCVFHSLGARTGRMSSSNPNLQNIPRPDERSAALIRQFFIPHEGRRLVAADFSQIELRVGAMYAEDRAMLRAFNEGADIHIRSAEMMFGKVDKQSRQLAKAANFCLEYVGTADKLQEYLAVVCGVHVTYVDVCDIVKRWHAAFPGMRRLAHSVVAEVTLNGGVRDALGRFYPVPRAEAYKGVNYKVQGTCAWILKSAILRLAHLLPEYDSHFLSFIHDEVLIDAPAEHCELRKEGDEWSAPEGGFLDSVRLAMEDHRRVELPITTPVEVSVCDENWSRKRKVASYYLEVS